VDTLSNREIEIFEMVGRGLTVAAIARKLRISTKTVQAHRENIKAKLDLGTSNELARYAVLWTDGGSRSDES
jgi:DNA-binding CsgD family transcriptional regulator